MKKWNQIFQALYCFSILSFIFFSLTLVAQDSRANELGSRLKEAIYLSPDALQLGSSNQKFNLSSTDLSPINIPNLGGTGPYAQEAIGNLLSFYQHSDHESIQDDLNRERAHDFINKCESIFKRRSVPTDLCWTPQVESEWQSQARSEVGAYGYWQFMYETGADYGLIVEGADNRDQFIPSTEAAAKYFQDNYSILGDWTLALAAYNAGAGTIQHGINAAGSHNFWIMAKEGVIPSETSSYVPAVVANILIGKNPKSYGFH